MTKHGLTWLACIMLLGGTLLLAARVDAPTRTVGESSVGGRLTALASCVLPASAADPSAAPAAIPEPTAAECDASAHHRLDGVWMTQC
jgi:hypothetical protein